MRNFKKMIILLAFGMTFVACQKKPAENLKPETTQTQKVETETKEEVEEKAEFPNSIKIDLQDEAYELQSFEGEDKYIGLASFSEYLKPTKHRFSIKANDKNMRINMKSGMYNFDEVKPVVEDASKEYEYELKLDNKSTKCNIRVVEDDYCVKLQDAMEVFGFKLDGENIIFDNPDTKRAENANDREYEWYEDQGHTGEYSDGNCGPTSMSMALKWIDQNSTKTGELCRNDVLNDGDWWNTNIVEDYFKANNVQFDSIFYKYPEIITDEIDKGNIVYVCAIMKEIEFNPEPDSSKFGRFYEFEGGHFFLVKGYKVIDGELYLEVYDPNNWDMKYSENGEPMGKDRLYKASEVDQAIKNWYMTVYSIYPQGK